MNLRFGLPIVLLFIMTVFLNHVSIAQPPVDAPAPAGADTAAAVIFENVEIEASFPGGEEGWRKFLEQNLKPNVPVDNGAPAGTYTVMVQFVVDKEGNVSQIKALTKHGYGMEGEVIRILRKSPKWTPAKQDGRMVKAYRKQPVTFRIIEERKKKKNRA